MHGEPSFGGESPTDPSNFALPGRSAKFGEFELDFVSRELRREGRAVAIPPQPLFLLMLLAARAGHVVDRNTIQGCLWAEHPPSNVDRSLNHVIRKLRGILRDDARDAAMIRTVHRRGYRFVHPVEWTTQAEGTKLARPTPTFFTGTTSTGPNSNPIGAEQAFFRHPRSDHGRAVNLELTISPLSDSADDASWPPLAEGAREELLTLLVGLPDSLGLTVIDDSAKLHEAATPAESLSRNPCQLELQGSVRRIGHRARCHLRLMSIADRTLVAAIAFELEVTSVFPLQRRIAELAVERLVRPMLSMTTAIKPG